MPQSMSKASQQFIEWRFANYHEAGVRRTVVAALEAYSKTRTGKWWRDYYANLAELVRRGDMEIK